MFQLDGGRLFVPMATFPGGRWLFQPLAATPKSCSAATLPNLTATQIPGGAGGHFWDKQTLSFTFREWKPLCLGSKCGGTRLINLAAWHEECQCLLVRPQRSFGSTQRGLPCLDGLGALDCKAGDAQGELCCIKAMLL